jgi:hypothetical protein
MKFPFEIMGLAPGWAVKICNDAGPIHETALGMARMGALHACWVREHMGKLYLLPDFPVNPKLLKT